ncbi:MAG: hypothetical protein CTY25_12110 [Methylobacterium sp.]|nr:MAG: hypothetical protein CTY25_12110 [Methylobacterium sp.]
MTTRYVIDIEATSFLGHPIEIGWARVGAETYESYLIKPPAEWREPLNWDWDPAAAEIHGITLDELIRDGLPPDEVIRRFEAAIGEGAILYSDAPAFDGNWLEKLYFVGSAKRPPRLLRSPLIPQHPPGYVPLHRAGPDALFLARLLNGEPPGFLDLCDSLLS